MKQGNPTTTVPQLMVAFSDQLTASVRHLEKASGIASEAEATLSEIDTQRPPADPSLIDKMRVVRSAIRAKRVVAIAGAFESIHSDALEFSVLRFWVVEGDGNTRLTFSKETDNVRSPYLSTPCVGPRNLRKSIFDVFCGPACATRLIC